MIFDKDDPIGYKLICIFSWICILFMIFYIVGSAYVEIQFYRAIPFKCEATLIRNDYIASTRSTHVAPIFSTNGKTSMAVYSTGHSEIFTTIWDCGKYGNIVSDSEHIFRYAKAKSILLLKELGSEIRIYDIER